jgi:hypothetical protein
VNQGIDIGPNSQFLGATGSQLRAVAEGGLSNRNWDLQFGYRLYVAQGGQAEQALRPQFTPLGNYSDDADALSAGGFVQHRVDLSGAFEMDEWTFRFSALGRLRQGRPTLTTGSFARTGHAHFTTQRDLVEHLALSFTTGVSAAATGASAYTDAYAWFGLHWQFEPVETRSEKD